MNTLLEHLIFLDCDCNRGKFVNEPTVEIKYEFDDYYNDYAYKEYIEAESILEYHREQIKNMSPRDFEFFVGYIFKKART